MQSVDEQVETTGLRAVRPAAVTLLAGALPVLGVTVLAWYGQSLASWFEAQPASWSAVVLAAAGLVLCGFALMPTHAVSLAAGFVLGSVVGPVVAWLTVLGAASLGYGIGRVLSGPGLAHWLMSRRRGAAVYQALVQASAKRSAVLVMLLRLSPLAPFAMTNVGLAALGLRGRVFLIATALGLMPRIAIVAWLGAGMAELDWASPNAPVLLIVGIAAAVVALLVVGRVAQKALRDAAQPTTTSITA